MQDNTDQKPSDESVQPAEVEGVEVAQAPAAEEETSSSSTDQEPTSTPETAADGGDKDKAPEVQTPAPLQPIVHKSGAPVFAIVAAILVAIGLAGVTVYAYMQTQKKPAADTTQTTTEDKSADDAKELDDTSKDVDEALEASEEADFPENELTDQNLNL